LQAILPNKRKRCQLREVDIPVTETGDISTERRQIADNGLDIFYILSKTWELRFAVFSKITGITSQKTPKI